MNILKKQVFLIWALFITFVLEASASVGVPSGNIEVTFYHSNSVLPIKPPATELFWGILKTLQTGSYQGFFYPLLFLVCLCIVFLQEKRDRKWEVFSLISAFAFSCWLTVRLGDGWDEFYIGVKHAYSLLIANRYSYNISNFQEGSGDFIPIFATGLLGKLGFPLVETFLTLGLFGNGLLIWVTYLFARSVGLTKRLSYVYAVCIGCFPCVLYTGITGFFSPLFTSALFFSIYLIFFSKTKKCEYFGIGLASFLTLFRLEGIVYAFLMWLVKFIICDLKKKTQKNVFSNAVKMGFLMAGPFFLSCLLRYCYFKHPFPAPVAFKNAGGDLTYFKNGIAYLLDVVRQYRLVWIWIGCVPAFMLTWKNRPLTRWFAAHILMLFVFSVPYVVGGGDWFPSIWARYLMPLVLFSYLAFFIVWSSWFEREWARALFFIGAVSFVCRGHVGIRTGSEVLDSLGVSPQRQVAFKEVVDGVKKTNWKWWRIDDLGYFGLFLNLTLPAKALIASPEEGTLMYYSFRDAQDMAGFADPDISYSPLLPLSPGDRMHRKRNPGVILKNKPSIIALFSMVTMTDQEDNLSDKLALSRAEKKFKELSMTDYVENIAYYRAGSPKYLQGLGYRYIVVSTPLSVFSYLVSDQAFSFHASALKKLSFNELAIKSYPYRIDNKLFESMSSGEELLSTNERK